MKPESTPTLRTRSERVVLRPAATADDAELLRVWKNANRAAFRDQSEIDAGRQAAWFAALQERDEDFMFMVVVDGVTAGSAGVRLADGTAEIYNFTLGRSEFGGGGHMSAALQCLFRFATERWRLPVTGVVLKGNRAMSLYRRNGVEVVRDLGDAWEVRWSGPPDDAGAGASAGDQDPGAPA